MKNQNTKLTPEQRIAQQAKVAALRAEANAIAKALREEEATEEVEETAVVAVETAEEVVETPAEEAEVTEEVAKTPAEEAEVTEEVIEAPEEEAEVAEEVIETPVEEAEVTEEVIEAPVEEAEVTEEVAETPEEEAEVTEEVTETPEEEAEVTEEVTETPEEEAEVTEEVTETPEEEAEVTDGVTDNSKENEDAENQDETDDEPNGFAKAFRWILGILGVGALVGILVMLLLMHFGKDNNQLPNDGTVNPGNGVVDTIPGGDEVPGDNDTVTPVAPEFDMDAFVASTVNIAKTLTTDENIAVNVDLFAGKIGADKLKELVGKYGELNVQKAVAEYLAFVPEIKMNQYINNNGLVYNPNAADDYYDMLDNADKAYMDATGKNPNGALMSLDGYDIHKSNRDAMKALIAESGDVALLTWYEAMTTGYDAMVQQNNDTAAALAYKEQVKLELVNNANGSLKLLELQLEQNVVGTDNNTLKYTDVYNEFIINNYMYVVAN